MPMLSRRAVLASLAAAIAVTAAMPATADEDGIAAALRSGGFVILLRHGATYADQSDTDPLHPENIAAQRQLDNSGRASAKAFGAALRQIGASVGKVYTSQFNRAYETATLAGFTDVEKTADLTEGGLMGSQNEIHRRAEALRKMLGTTPSAGTNTVLVTHKPNIVEALGRDWFDVREGEASIFRPLNGGYRLVARVPIEEWPRLAAQK